MSNYRRAYVPGGSFFFTLVMERRAPIFRSQIARTCLGTALRGYDNDSFILRPQAINSVFK